MSQERKEIAAELRKLRAAKTYRLHRIAEYQKAVHDYMLDIREIDQIMSKLHDAYYYQTGKITNPKPIKA